MLFWKDRDPGVDFAHKFCFGFYRFKKRGADTVQLEFNQTIYKDAKTGKWHVDE